MKVPCYVHVHTQDVPIYKSNCTISAMVGLLRISNTVGIKLCHRCHVNRLEVYICSVTAVFSNTSKHCCRPPILSTTAAAMNFDDNCTVRYIAYLIILIWECVFLFNFMLSLFRWQRTATLVVNLMTMVVDAAYYYTFLWTVICAVVTHTHTHTHTFTAHRGFSVRAIILLLCVSN